MDPRRGAITSFAALPSSPPIGGIAINLHLHLARPTSIVTAIDTHYQMRLGRSPGEKDMRQCRLLMSTFVALGLSAATATTVSAAPTADEVLASYADIAHAGYGDARITAEKLLEAVKTLRVDPTTEALAASHRTRTPTTGPTSSPTRI
jgi:uncharacterized iron-regulated protein